MWGSGLQKFAWRIDVKSKARNVSEMNEPVAIVELTIGKKVRAGFGVHFRTSDGLMLVVTDIRRRRKKKTESCGSKWAAIRSRTYSLSSMQSSNRLQLVLPEVDSSALMIHSRCWPRCTSTLYWCYYRYTLV